MIDDAILVTHVAGHQHPLLPRHVEETAAGWQVVARVDVRPPVRNSFDQFDESYPWREAVELQERSYREIAAAMRTWPDARVIYMGFVPIPLAIHLGSLFGQTVDVTIFQYHHTNLNWRWTRDDATPALLLPPSHSPAKPSFEGHVLLSVAVSYPVAVEDTKWISADGWPEYHLSLAKPAPDGICSPSDLRTFAAAFRGMLDDVHTKFPSSRSRDLVAAVPAGAGFVMGQQINPTRHFPIQTWKFLASRRRRFARALCLGEFTDLPRVVLLGASPLDRNPISAAGDIQAISELLAPHDDRVEVHHRPAIHASTLAMLLDDLQPSVLHVACHGELDGGSDLTVLVLMTPEGWSCSVDTSDLASLLEHAQHLQCVVLMACMSADLAKTVAQRIPTAIGYEGLLGDRDASGFSHAFWSSLVGGHSVGEAFHAGSLAVGESRVNLRLEVAKGVDPNTIIPITKP